MGGRDLTDYLTRLLVEGGKLSSPLPLPAIRNDIKEKMACAHVDKGGPATYEMLDGST